jgi:hypothetical protein
MTISASGIVDSPWSATTGLGGFRKLQRVPRRKTRKCSMRRTPLRSTGARLARRFMPRARTCYWLMSMQRSVTPSLPCSMRMRPTPTSPPERARSGSLHSLTQFLLMQHRPQETPSSIHATLRSRSRWAGHCRMPRSARYSRTRVVVCRSLHDGGNGNRAARSCRCAGRLTQPSTGGMS